MTLFDPYSHGRILELRQEQLARAARRRRQLRLDEPATIGSIPTAAAVRAILARVSHSRKPSGANACPSGRPALDS